jgi:hypothetical protein
MTAGSKRFGSDRLRPAPVVVVTEQDHVPLVLSIVEPCDCAIGGRNLNKTGMDDIHRRSR